MAVVRLGSASAFIAACRLALEDLSAGRAIEYYAHREPSGLARLRVSYVSYSAAIAGIARALDDAEEGAAATWAHAVCHRGSGWLSVTYGCGTIGGESEHH